MEPEMFMQRAVRLMRSELEVLASALGIEPGGYCKGLDDGRLSRAVVTDEKRYRCEPHLIQLPDCGDLEWVTL
jgi:hypothetical protein